MKTATYLLLWGRQQSLVLQEFHDDGVTKPKPCAGLVLTPKGAQQLVVAPTPTDGAQLAGTVKALKHDACGVCGGGGHKQPQARTRTCGWQLAYFLS